MNDLISREDTMRRYCFQHCGCAPEECPCTLEQDGAEECYVFRFLKSIPLDPNLKPIRWIYVDEALPEEWVPVLGAIYTTDYIVSEPDETFEEAMTRADKEAAQNPRVTLCFWVADDGWYSSDGWPMVCSPRCWAALPEAPRLEDSE